MTGFAQPLGDLGIAAAFVQRRELTDRHLRAGFTLATAIGIAVAIALAAAAPLAAMVMKDARVMPVLRVLSIGFAIQGTAVVAAGLLRRRMDFRRLFFIDTSSYVIGYGGVAVALALFGFGVWGLVWGALVQTCIAAGAQVAAAHHPLRPLAAGRETRELLSFGVGAGLSTWINYLALNADNFIVGRALGAASLGLYARAYNLMNLPYTYVASVISGVLYPAFARLQDDVLRLRRGYLLMTQLTALVAGASMAALAISAPHLVPTLYGSRWAGAVAPLQILCAAGYFRALYNVGSVVAHSAGRVYSELRRQLLYAALVIVGSVLGSRYGLSGVAVGVDIAIVVMFVATGQLALQITRTRWREYFRAQIDAVVIAAVTGAFALFARIVLERAGVPGGGVAFGTLAAAAVPWSIAAGWTLGAPEFQLIKTRLPRSIGRIVELLRPRERAR